MMKILKRNFGRHVFYIIMELTQFTIFIFSLIKYFNGDFQTNQIYMIVVSLFLFITALFSHLIYNLEGYKGEKTFDIEIGDFQTMNDVHKVVNKFNLDAYYIKNKNETQSHISIVVINIKRSIVIEIKKKYNVNLLDYRPNMPKFLKFIFGKCRVDL